MRENIGNFIISNDKLYLNNACELNKRNTEKAISLYEVIRIINGIPLFIEEHLKRLQESAIIKNIPLKEKAYYENNTIALIKANRIENGNIKIKIEATADTFLCNFSQIQHHYPTKEQYEEGIKAALFNYERKEPQAKILRPQWRAKAEIIKKEKAVYELLLVNNENQITEGSKSNVFFIKNDTLHTAPYNKVLQGITRKKIIAIANKHKIKIQEKNIHQTTISEFDAAFISGTSPKILTLHSIDDISYDVNHPIIRLLKKEYDKLIVNYLKNAKIQA
jgi:branched-chain amino acid aminotransferase